jgi:hypothetical protein
MRGSTPSLSCALRDLRARPSGCRDLASRGKGRAAGSPSGAGGGACRVRIRALPDRVEEASGSVARAEAQRTQHSLQVGPRPSRGALAHHHQHVEAAACFSKGFEGVPGDSSAGATGRSGSRVRLPSFEVDRDVFGRRPCVDTLLDGYEDVGRSKPVQCRCRTADKVPGACSGADRWRPTEFRADPPAWESGCAAPDTTRPAGPRCSHDVRRLCVCPGVST